MPVNIRVIATTNRSLYHEVAQGRFREDLFYRLNVFPITVPPLRERTGDVALLARHFVKAAAQRNGLPVPTLSSQAIAELSARPWKGNVRELEEVIEGVVARWRGQTVLVQDLPQMLREQCRAPGSNGEAVTRLPLGHCRGGPGKAAYPAGPRAGSRQ